MEQLLTLFNCFSRLVKEAFQDDPRFLTARDKVSSAPSHVSTRTTTTTCVTHCYTPDKLRAHRVVKLTPDLFSLQAYKAVVNDATIFKLELPMKQKG